MASRLPESPLFLDAITIAQSGTLSGAATVPVGATLVALVMSTWDDATVQLSVSPDGTTYYPLMDASGRWTAASPGDQDDGWVLALDPALTAGVAYIKVLASASQGAAVTITPVVRKVA